MNETSKATNRRRLCPAAWDHRLQKDDWPFVTNLILFDKEQGDANHLEQHFKEGEFDFVHGSQVLEHLHNPHDVIRQMLRIVKPGGWVILTVPDYDLYEQRIFPSRWNGDHKTTWSLWREIPPSPKYTHVFVPDLKTRLLPHEVQADLIHSNYDFMKLGVDQTFVFEDLVEAYIEILILKSTNA